MSALSRQRRLDRLEQLLELSSIDIVAQLDAARRRVERGESLPENHSEDSIKRLEAQLAEGNQSRGDQSRGDQSRGDREMTEKLLAAGKRVVEFRRVVAERRKTRSSHES